MIEKDDESAEREPRIRELLHADNEPIVARTCDAVPRLPSRRTYELANNLEALFDSPDLRVQQTAASAFLSYDATNEKAMAIAGRALKAILKSTTADPSSG